VEGLQGGHCSLGAEENWLCCDYNHKHRGGRIFFEQERDCRSWLFWQIRGESPLSVFGVFVGSTQGGRLSSVAQLFENVEYLVPDEE